MKTVKQAFRRFAFAKSDFCYREYNGAGKHVNKARRILDKAIIEEQLSESVVEPEPVETGVTFRIVLSTQIHENYGAHDWDGKGECPQYWKAKGGNEYQLNLGSANDVIAMGSEEVRQKAEELRSEIERCDEYFEEHAIGWELVPSNVKTYEEEMEAWFDN